MDSVVLHLLVVEVTNTVMKSVLLRYVCAKSKTKLKYLSISVINVSKKYYIFFLNSLLERRAVCKIKNVKLRR